MKIRGQLFTLRIGTTDIGVLKSLIDTAAADGMNLVCLEIEKALRYDSHPEVSPPRAISRDTLADIVSHAKSLGLEAVPMLPLFSHTQYLTEVYPKMKETAGVYCTSNSETYRVVFDLMDEIIEIFQSNFFHIGHDEALTAYDMRKRTTAVTCPKCRNKKPYRLFRDDVKKLHGFLKKRGIRTMMWADMLLDPAQFADKSFCQSGCYGGPPDHFDRCIDELPKDIIMCDWHYEPAREFPTVRYLQDKGFETLGCPEFPYNTYLFTRYAEKTKTKRFAGMMATSWCLINKKTLPRLKKLIRGNGKIFRDCKKFADEDPLAGKIRRRCAEAQETINPGRFRKVFSFNLAGAAILHSSGWRDFRYMEYPDAAHILTGKTCPASLDLKPDRYGEIFYDFQASTGTVFRQVFLKVWMDCPGSNSVSVLVPGISEWRSLAVNKNFSGDKIDLSSQVAGNNSFTIRFSAESRRKKRVPVLKRFEISGYAFRR